MESWQRHMPLSSKEDLQNKVWSLDPGKNNEMATHLIPTLTRRLSILLRLFFRVMSSRLLALLVNHFRFTTAAAVIHLPIILPFVLNGSAHGATLAGVTVDFLPFTLDEIEVFQVDGVDTVTHNGTNKTVIYFGSALLFVGCSIV